MATNVLTLSTSVWTKITDAGESGICFKKAGQHVVIDHTDQETASTLPLTNTNVTVGKSKRVPLDMDSNDVLSITADNTSDIFYALAIEEENDNEIFKIVVDVI